MAYLIPDTSNLAALLEVIRASDTVLFLWSLTNLIDETGENLYATLYSMGLPAVSHAVMVSYSGPFNWY